MQREQMKVWQKLTDAQRELLAIASMYYEEVSIQELVRLLNRLDISTDDDERFQPGTLSRHLTILENLGMVSFTRKGRAVIVSPEWRETIMRWAASTPEFRYLVEQFRHLVPYNQQWWSHSSVGSQVREWRLAYYSQDKARLLQLERHLYTSPHLREGPIQEVLVGSPDIEWLFRLPTFWFDMTIDAILRHLLIKLAASEHLLTRIGQATDWLTKANSSTTDLLAQLHLLRGDFAALETLISQMQENWQQYLYRSSLRAIAGRDQEAVDLFEVAVQAYRKNINRRTGIPGGIASYLAMLSLLRLKGIESLPDIEIYSRQFEQRDALFATVLEQLQLYLHNKPVQSLELYQQLLRSSTPAVASLVFAQLLGWTDQPIVPTITNHLLTICQKAEQHGYRWYAMELNYVLAMLLPDQATAHLAAAEALNRELGGISFSYEAVPHLERWEMALEALHQLTQSNGSRSNGVQRLAWFVDFDDKVVEAREQSLTKSGNWSKGRKVSPRRIGEGAVAAMSEQDYRMAHAVEVLVGRNHRESGRDYDFGRAVLALVGHPYVFLAQNPAVSVELVHREPRLLLEEVGEDLEMRFAQDFLTEGVYCVRETPTRYAVYEISEQLAQIRQQIGESIRVPARARDRARRIGEQLSRVVKVQSTLSEDLADLPTQAGDPLPHVHLLPLGDGFKIECFVKPLPDEVYYLKPGQGRERIIFEIGDHQRVVARDLTAETERVNAVLAACPTLAQLPHHDYEWLLDDTEKCLHVLTELYPLREEGIIVIEHPKGEKIKITGLVAMSDLSLRVQEGRNWFDVSGELRINEGEVLDFRDLIRRIRKSDSRFVELSEGQYLALTDQLRQRLNDIEGLLSSDNQGLQIHHLAAGYFDGLAEELSSFEADRAWQQQLARLSAAQRTNPPVPDAFKAELRPYQMEGFQWLMRLAEWGVGACLADDMGLGKTVQALAVLTARAELGPALVIAPASVTRNWQREAVKFAPKLRAQLLGPGDRAEVINALGPGDLLLVSYGLLPFEGERLAERTFATIVLDEAQAIKNRQTKRSRVAMQLQGDFKLVTTGTPIENHLGELWNLFNFLNPGLLGSHQRFGEKYAIPIIRHQDEGRREQLRRLLQPFILRRRKDEVLQELPPKTEVTLYVDLTPAEQAFYEALRQEALEEIARMEPIQQRFQILAQLTKLRQAACHPRLVQPHIEIGSSKLDLVGETIKELLENGHKALVFSQFVRHLRIVEEWVKKERIPYQYLDGSTPGAQRDTAVQAFQRGEGQLFLISLKAGGTGLTLTEADYVLHLDPWWNPAVEDQASDRAHRIGQERPVTVYRFVAENTIEEKIVQLHQEKRDLADSLLAGTESSAAMSVDQLLDLIKAG